MRKNRGKFPSNFRRKYNKIILIFAVKTAQTDLLFEGKFLSTFRTVKKK